MISFCNCAARVRLKVCLAGSGDGSMETPGRIIRSHVTTVVYARLELDWHIRHADDDDHFRLALPIGVFFMLSRKYCGQFHIHKVF